MFITSGTILTTAVIIINVPTTVARYTGYEAMEIFLIKCIRKVRTNRWNP